MQTCQALIREVPSEDSEVESWANMTRAVYSTTC